MILDHFMKEKDSLLSNQQVSKWSNTENPHISAHDPKKNVIGINGAKNFAKFQNEKMGKREFIGV